MSIQFTRIDDYRYETGFENGLGNSADEYAIIVEAERDDDGIRRWHWTLLQRDSTSGSVGIGSELTLDWAQRAAFAFLQSKRGRIARLLDGGS